MSFFDELQDVPITELAQLHNEQLQLPSDKSSDEGSEPENLPVFSIEQIDALKVYHPPANPQVAEKYRRVASKLSALLLDAYCDVCSKMGHVHYTSRNHHKNISKWLQAELRTSDPDVHGQVFCAPCNLALNRESPDDHYSSETHQRCAELYCGCCQRHMSSPQVMSAHLQAKAHRKNQLKYPHCEYMPVAKQPKESAELARRLSELIGGDLCLICKDASETHRYSKQHISNILAWIQFNDINQRFYPSKVDLLFCAACDAVSLPGDTELEHHRTPMHTLNAEKYCDECQLRFPDVHESKQHLQTAHPKPNAAITPVDTEPEESQDVPGHWTENAGLEDKVLVQLEEIADKVLVYKTVSGQHALSLLKKLNAELADISKPKEPEALRPPPKQIAQPKMSQVGMELGRLRAMVAPRNRLWLSRNAALNYMSNLMGALVAVVHPCRPDYMFSVHNNWTNCTEELLESVVLATEQMVWDHGLGALPLIQQFNAHLECLIQSRRDGSIL